jgi:hypothetical protein
LAPDLHLVLITRNIHFLHDLRLQVLSVECLDSASPATPADGA